jgi:hypothetical protein
MAILILAKSYALPTMGICGCGRDTSTFLSYQKEGQGGPYEG